MRTGMRRFVQDVGLSFVSLAISALVQFVLRVFLGNRMGDTGFGIYTLAFAVYSIGMLLGAFGVGAALTKYVAEFKEDVSRTKMLLTNGIVQSFAIGCIMGALLFAGAPVVASHHLLNKPELVPLLRIISIVFPFIAIEKATLGFLNGLRRMRPYAIINIAQNLFIVALTVILVYSGYGLKGAAWGLVLPVVALSLFSLLSVRDSLTMPSLSSFSTGTKLLLGFGAFVVLANGIDLLNSYTDSMLVSHFKASGDVGVYSAAQTLAQAVTLPSMALQMITGPMIAALWGKRDNAGIEKLVNTTLRFTAAFIIPVVFAAVILAPDLIRFIFRNPEYSAAIVPLRILLIGSGFVAIWASVGAVLSSTAYVRVIFIMSSITWVVNAILNILLIPRFGITGSAAATSSATFLAVLLQLYTTRRLLGIRIQWAWLFGIVLFSGLLGGGCLVLTQVINSYACLPIFLVPYGVVFFKFFLGRGDLESIKGLIRRDRQT